MIALVAAMALAPDVVLADFEGPNYGDWVVTGTAFGPGPARGTLPNQMPVTGFRGVGLVNTFFGGDGATGTLTSPEFTISRRYLSFLIGGGKDLERTVLQLLVDGKVVRRATGPNSAPGGSEALRPDGWDVREFRERRAQIRIIDSATGGWGHLNVDHLVLTDRKPVLVRMNALHSLTFSRRFLRIPIKNGAPMRKVTFRVDGLPPVTNDVELADGPADWFAIVDVARWKGRKLQLEVDALPSDSTAFALIDQVEEVQAYREPSRGGIRFSPRTGWNNDPNGMVFYRGEYHLFFQANPYGIRWGNMHWGHAVSKDLVHWAELPIALFPDPMGTMFSGSAVVDVRDSGGFGPGAMVLLYTAAGEPFTQALASSTDGRTFTKWAGNPILGNRTGGNRDPKVIWHEPTQRWVMVLYVERNGVHTIEFFTSTDLKAWSFTSAVDGFYECPDFFPLRAPDGQDLWLLTGANSDYQLGRFDGERFIPTTPILKGHRGRGFYAAQTFSDVPGRRIQIGWYQAETPGMPFNQAMSIPLELSLRATPEGPRLAWSPVPELAALRGPAWTSLKGEADYAEVDLVFPKDRTVTVDAGGVIVRLDGSKSELTVGEITVAAPALGEQQTLRVFVDRVGLEVFAADGTVYVPYPGVLKSRRVSVEASAPLTRGVIYPLKSIWP